MKKRVLAVLLTLVLLCQWGAVLPVSAAGSSKGNAETIVLDETVRPYLEKGTTHWYRITPDETQYYRFTFSNRSLEVRTGIGLADDLLNLFVGKMTVTIYDQYDTKLAVQDIRCGYEASISRLLQEGNTYYVTVTSSVSGNYFMTTQKLADIGGNSWQQATEILPTGQFASAIDAAGEKDWFCFRAGEERAYYNFSLENLNGGTKYFYLYEYVEGAGETPLRSITDFSVSSGKTYSKDLQLNSGSLYYYVIQSTSSGTGGYVMSTAETLDAAGNTQDQAYEVNTQTAYISSFDGTGDADWFAFETAEFDAYYHLNFKRLSGSSYLYMQFYDADGNMLEGSRRYEEAEETYTCNVKLAPNTTYYVYLRTESEMGNYTFSVDVKADPYPNQQKDAVEIETNHEYSSSFDGTGDADWFSFKTAEFDAYYHLNFKRLSGSSYLYMQFYDADGNMLEGSRRYEEAEETYTCNVKLAPNTTYYVYLRTESEMGNYTFSVDVKADPYPNQQKDAVEIETNHEYSSSFDGTGDADWFSFKTAEFDAYYHLNFKRLSGSSYLYMQFYDADGNMLEGSRRYEEAEETYTCNVKLAPNTTYYVYLRTESEMGNYTFSVTEKLDEDADKKEEATEITLGTKNERELQANSDVDWFVVEVTTGGEYQIDVLNESCSYLKCEVYTARDRELLDFSDTKPVNVTLEPGTYYIKFSGTKGYYTFTMRSLLPGDTNGDGVINGLDNKGDVDGDGSITSTDARLTLQYYAGKIGRGDLNTAVADVDGDGTITSTDARLILQYYAGKITAWP